MKICIVGGSGHYRYALEALTPGVQLCGYAPGSPDEDLGKLAEAIAKLGLTPTRHADWRDMLAAEKPAVVVVNPHFADIASVSLACIEQGIHVFCEKPVATEWEALHALRAALAKQPGLVFAAMFGIRYTPPFLAAHAALMEGRIGEVRLLQAQKSYKLGRRPPFFSRRERYGGSILWVGCHAVDWVHWFAGRPFRAVSAHHSRIANDGNGELEVSAQCQFTLDDEIMAQVSLDYLRPAAAPSHDDDRLRVVGTHGVLDVRDGQAILTDAAGQRALPLPPPGSIFADFLHAVRGEGPCMVSAEDSFAVTEACLKARQAADEARALSWS